MRKNLIKLTLAAILLSYIGIYSQVTQEWAARYNTPINGSDEGTSVTVDGSGNVYVTGGSYENWNENINCITIKYNSAGIQQWVQTYNGPGSNVDRGASIVVDLAGNVYVAGTSAGLGTASDYLIIKYNSAGIQQWVQRYNGTGNNSDYAASMAVDGSGNVYVTGWSGGGSTFDDYATIKYNSDGVQQWVQRYNGPGNNSDAAYSIVIDLSGNIYITGKSTGIGTSFDYATIKYNPSGNLLWVQRYDASENEEDNASSIAVDLTGNVYVTGRSFKSGNSTDYVTLKYNSSGIQQWIQRYNGTASSHDEPNSIVVDILGNVYITGGSIGIGTSRDYATLKYNSSGVQQWVQLYTGLGTGIDAPHSIAIDALGNVYVTGQSMNTANSVYDYVTIKYNSAGTEQWLHRYNGTGNGQDWALSIALDNFEKVYVTGGSIGIGSDLDIVTIKYSQTIGIQQISGEVPKQFSLSQNFPNPFNPTTNIEFQIPRSGLVNLTIYDALGRKVETIVNQNLNPGTYKADWDAYNYPSGVYFYRLSAGDFAGTKKMILVK